MAVEFPDVVLLQACYVYKVLSQKYKFKIRNKYILFNLIIYNESKISRLKEKLDPEETCKTMGTSFRIRSLSERLALTTNAIALMEWVLDKSSENR
jgi:hypothetical protein